MIQSTLLQAADSVRMPENAPLAVVALLGTGALIAGAILAAAISAALGRRRLAAWILAGGAGVVAVYAAALLGPAISSRERVIPAGGRKYFCEIDCHLAVSVEKVEIVRSLGSGSASLSPRGKFLVARIRTWFDPSTTAPWRGNETLTPNPKTAWVVDESGRRYPLSQEGMRAAADGRLPVGGLGQPLRPGESAMTTLVFDVPADAARPRLFLGDPPGVEGFLVGHENSPFHEKVFFALDV